MKKISFTSVRSAVSAACATALSLGFGASALANSPIGTIPTVGDGEVDLVSAAEAVINGILMILGIIAVLIIIVAGLRLLVGGADEGQREKARDQILYAVIGLIVIFLASAIVNFVATNIL